MCEEDKVGVVNLFNEDDESLLDHKTIKLILSLTYYNSCVYP